MNIAVVTPKHSFTDSQVKDLESLGTVTFTSDGKEMTDQALKLFVSEADILVLDPDNFGGFEKARGRMNSILDCAKNVKGITLTTTSFGWVDLDYCKKRKITVSNIPGYSQEAVAEQTLAYLLGAAKRIFITDRKTQLNSYHMEMGMELKEKTLGIIGIGNIGSRVAELALGIGMNVIASNRTVTDVPKSVTLVSIDEVFKKSDAITLHVTHEDSNQNMISTLELSKMKQGVIIVNTVDRTCIDELAMANALSSGQVGTYVYEGEDISQSPLKSIEHAVVFKGFGWFTKESIENLYKIVVENVRAIVKQNPIHLVN